MKEIDVKELKKELESKDSSHIVIDVRTPAEREESRISGTVNIPMSRIGEQLPLLEKYDAVYVHCGTGARSGKVCEDLSSLGLKNVVNIRGGVAAWDEQGFGVIKKGNISILRQVRIAAGLLVLTGLFFGVFVDQYYLLLSAFVSLGLIFAGVTNKCGLALLLIHAPWNKI